MLKKLLSLFVPKKADELEEETLSEIIQIRVTPSQKELLDSICEWQHTNKSDLIRKIIFKTYIDDIIKG
nr:MAG TPA: NikA, BACTERIAL CONJUGATION, RELAXASE, DNA [Caudoviricetes sp.]